MGAMPRQFLEAIVKAGYPDMPCLISVDFEVFYNMP